MAKLTQEEIEYRRYLRRRINRRKRRRRVMIARVITLLVVILLFWGIFAAIKTIYKSITNGNIDNKAKITNTVSPKATEKLPDINVPEGYEEIYKKLLDMRKDYNEVTDILLNLSQYPIDILELAVNNSETLDFVVDYPKHQYDVVPNGEINKSELEYGIPLFQQWDKRWGYVTYGDEIIALNGCGPTCMSMIYTGLTGDTTKSPVEMAEFCMDKNYYDDANGTSWVFMSTGAELLGLKSERINTDEESIKYKLKEGKPIICSMAPGDFTTQGHFIVLTDIDDNGQLTINDPNSIKNSEQEWDIERVVNQMKAAWAYSVDDVETD